MLKLTQAQMHTLVCTNHKKDRKDPMGSWETPQAIKRAILLKEIEMLLWTLINQHKMPCTMQQPETYTLVGK